MELINRIRKSRKGFTLVEIIVVLVILAILAAFTIPTMLGFVNDARDKAAIAQVRIVYVAAQAAATEVAATDNIALTTAFTTAQQATILAKITAMTNDDLAGKGAIAITYKTDAPKIDSVSFTPTGGKKITIQDGKVII